MFEKHFICRCFFNEYNTCIEVACDIKKTEFIKIFQHLMNMYELLDTIQICLMV